jgi:hypothetical protein
MALHSINPVRGCSYTAFVNFGIGYELGVRAPTDVYTFRRMLSDSFSTRLHKFILHYRSLGFSQRRSQLDDNRLRTKSRLDAERKDTRKNLEQRGGNTDESTKNRP